jgi:predicted pyridoxine 5'-phosphate oxidase superfamily flavin-nucleotide-binding protein
MTNKTFTQPCAIDPQAGFSLLEVAISGVILMVGLIAMLGVFALAISTTQGVQLDQIAKQKAMDTLESIYTARATQQITFAQIANTGSGGIFTTGAVNGILTDGPDGLAGTADDGTTPQGTCPLPYQCAILPGPDGLLGTADDITVKLNNFTRTIAINNTFDALGNVNPDLKQVVVTIGYTDAHGAARNYVVQALISSYR